MDTFTHIVAITLILSSTGNMLLIPFGVLGAVIIDIDVGYTRIARRRPSNYLLFHGGINHTLLGATVLSAIGVGVAFLLLSIGLLPASLSKPGILAALLAALAGAYLHLFLDWLPGPGTPLLYPWTEKKYGLSVYPMSFYFLITLLSLASLVIILLGGLTTTLSIVYGALFTGITLIGLGLKGYVSTKAPGTSYPTLNPLQWIVIREEDSSYSVRVYAIGRGVVQHLSFEKYKDITPAEARVYDSLVEVRRHRYFSYITTVEKRGEEIVFHDPVREQGLIAYPPWYPSVTLPARITEP